MHKEKTRKHKRLVRLGDRQRERRMADLADKNVIFIVPADQDELDLRVSVPMAQAKRVIMEDSKMGKTRRTNVRRAAGAFGTRVRQIIVIPGDQRPEKHGESVTVGANWVVNRLEQ